MVKCLLSRLSYWLFVTLPPKKQRLSQLPQSNGNDYMTGVNETRLKKIAYLTINAKEIVLHWIYRQLLKKGLILTFPPLAVNTLLASIMARTSVYSVSDTTKFLCWSTEVTLSKFFFFFLLLESSRNRLTSTLVWCCFVICSWICSRRRSSLKPTIGTGINLEKTLTRERWKATSLGKIKMHQVTVTASPSSHYSYTTLYRNCCRDVLQQLTSQDQGCPP